MLGKNRSSFWAISVLCLQVLLNMIFLYTYILPTVKWTKAVLKMVPPLQFVLSEGRHTAVSLAPAEFYRVSSMISRDMPRIAHTHTHQHNCLQYHRCTVQKCSLFQNFSWGLMGKQPGIWGKKPMSEGPRTVTTDKFQYLQNWKMTAYDFF